MFKFNNNGIFAGYIKQLLADFNLPKFYHGKWTCEEDPTYYYNKKIPNKTKNLIIKDNVYDSYTHEYLGEFLRFQRDFHNLNLMSLYNCFSNKICTNINIINNNKAFEFNAADENYKIYMLPVRPGTTYTIALDSSTPVELCCVSYGKYYKEYYEDTYKKFTTMTFNNPQLYTISNKQDILEQDFKLLIKVSTKIVSSIVIIEGDYIGFNDNIYQLKQTHEYNDYVINFRPMIDQGYKNNKGEEVYKEEDFQENQPVKYISPLQLLMFNTGYSAPFADRLVEYLTGNAITENEDILDNVKRVQAVMELNTTTENIEWIEDGKLKNKLVTTPITFKYEGIWENKMRALLYAYIKNGTLGNSSPGSLNIFSSNVDILGYADKTLEQHYKGIKTDIAGKVIIDNKTGKRVYNPTDMKNKHYLYTTIADVDLYPEIYKDSKEVK